MTKENDILNEKIFNQSLMLHKTIETFITKLSKMVAKSKNKIVSEQSLFNELGYKIPYVMIIQIMHGMKQRGMDTGPGRTLAMNINEQILIGMMVSCKGSGIDVDETFRFVKEEIFEKQGSKIREDYERDLESAFLKLGV